MSSKINLEVMLPFMLNKIVKMVNISVEGSLGATGLSTAAWRVLATLSFTKIDRPTGIADFTGIELSTLSRTLDRMVEQELILRKKPPVGRRGFSIVLTSKGKRTHERSAAIVQREHDKLIALLPKSDASTLLRIITSLYRAVGTATDVRTGADPLGTDK